MAGDDKKHFWIPSSNVSRQPIDKTPYGRTYERDSYKSHGEKLGTKLQSVTSRAAAKTDASLTKSLFFKVTVPADEKIKNAVQKLQNIGLDVVSYSSREASAGTAVIQEVNLSSLEDKIRRYASEENNPNKSSISILEDIDEVSVEEKVDPVILGGEPTTKFDCNIYTYSLLSNEEKDLVFNHIIQALKTQGIQEFRKIFLPNKKAFVSANLAVDTIKEIAADYITVNSVTINDQLVIPESTDSTQIPETIQVNQPKTSQCIAILDTGINASSRIFQNLVTRDLTFLPRNQAHDRTAHGTFVASRAIFGDELETQIRRTLTPICRVLDVPVFFVNSSNELVSISESELLPGISKLVERISQTVRIFNLSFGLKRTITQNYRISEFAKLLDFLSNEYDVLFVNSAGNISKQDSDYPDYFHTEEVRITVPGDSLSVVTVGSYAKLEADDSLVEKDSLSPFSRRGPGPHDIIKPELVEHGGNLTSDWEESPRTAVYGVNPQGTNISYSTGTSYSAPLVANYAAQILDKYQDISMNLVKALLFHFTSPIITPNVNGFDSVDFAGFGRPNIERALRAEDSSVTMLYEGKLNRDNYEIINFHIPKALQVESKKKMKIKVTLVHNPPVNVDNDMAYSQSRIVPHVIKITERGAQEISFKAEERSYTEFGPVYKGSKDFSRGYVTGSWAIKLRLYTRGQLVDNFQQSYALIVELIDPSGQRPVYKSFEESFDAIYSTRRKAA